MISNTTKLTRENFPINPERATLEGQNKYLGFWFFLCGETVLFACLIGTYLALKNSYSTGLSSNELFEYPLILIATIFLLTSSLTSALAVYEMKRFKFVNMQLWFFITVLLGCSFLALEVYEFIHYVDKGFKFTTSPFSSSFYTLVGFHGAHVSFGILWFLTLMLRNAKSGLSLVNAPKYYLASLYWHFVDVVWVFIFTVVYLLGMVG
ncbi:MAG: cytochrome oxidoreductase [Bacillales bacterium]|jgi:cytochrome c oxidase subunit 3|nr:cytochrome oxidoreductase [Bacillales bacterium]